MPIDLHTTTDVKKVRETLYKAQGAIDPITGEKIPSNQAVLDHDHSTQFVRAVLHRQSNAVLGKIENLWKRYLAWWYTGTLSQFLRGCADYLDKEHPQEYTHPKWKAKVTTEFNKLSATQKDAVLKSLNLPKGTNDKQRKEIFKKALDKNSGWTYNAICEIIKGVNK